MCLAQGCPLVFTALVYNPLVKRLAQSAYMQADVPAADIPGYVVDINAGYPNPYLSFAWFILWLFWLSCVYTTIGGAAVVLERPPFWKIFLIGCAAGIANFVFLLMWGFPSFGCPGRSSRCPFT